MAGSWYLGKLSGIDLRVHWTFLLLPAWVFFSSLFGGSGAVTALVSVIFILAVFGCVVLHEMGHALMARFFGVGTRDITLLPIGGVASLERMPRQPHQELAIAVAGPAVNLVIAPIAFLVAMLVAPLSATMSALFVQLAVVNLALIVFNLLPAFPMDGGRVLRSILVMRMPYENATHIAVKVGKVAAIAFGIFGLLSGNLMLAVIAAFIFLAASGEAARVGAAPFGLDNPIPRPLSGEFPLSAAPARTSLLDRIGPNMPDIRRLPIVSARLNAKNALGGLGGQSPDECLVSSRGSVIGLIRKSDLLRAVQSGRGAVAIESLLAYGLLPLRRFYAR